MLHSNQRHLSLQPRIPYPAYFNLIHDPLLLQDLRCIRLPHRTKPHVINFNLHVECVVLVSRHLGLSCLDRLFHKLSPHPFYVNHVLNHFQVMHQHSELPDWHNLAIVSDSLQSERNLLERILYGAKRRLYALP